MSILQQDSLQSHAGKAIRIIDQVKRERREPTREERISLEYHRDMADIMATLRRQALRLEGLESAGATSSRANTNPWPNFGEFLQAVRLVAVRRADMDPRLTVRAASGLNETVDSEGGFLVPQDFVADLVARLYETSEIARRCQRVPMTRNRVALPSFDETSRANGSRFGGVRAYWKAEAAAITATKPKYRTTTLELKKLIGACYVTDELLQDSEALAMTVSKAFADEFAFELDRCIVFGSGVGQPLGVMESPALITAAKEAGQAAGTLVPDNIAGMFGRCWGPSRKTAVWLINQDAEVGLYKADWTQAPGIFTAAGNGSPYCQLFGRPVIPTEYCEVLGTLGDIVLIDPARYALADGGTSTAVSSHVRFVENESVFRFTLRVDAAPIDNAPLTPYKGANTLSPFVALEAR